MIAVAIGTTTWRQTDTLGPSEVAFTGVFRYAADGSELMIWDAGLTNMRAMTDPEVAAIPGQQLTNTQTTTAASLTQSITDNSLIAALRALMLIALDEINLLRGVVIGTGSLVFDPANMTNGTGVTSAAITVTGAAFGDLVDVAAPYTLAGIIAKGYVSAANTVTIRLHNGTGGAVNLGSGTWTVVVRRQPAMPARTKTQLVNAMTAKIMAGDADL